MSKLLLFICLAGICLISFPMNAFPTPNFAQQTGKPCRACHIDPAGGGPLNAEGSHFLEELKSEGRLHPRRTGSRLLLLLAGYLHLVTAIFWFGTILYVHLLLKPAYAARGLPRGELLVGWISIVIMTVTGLILAIHRIPAWGMLIHSRFGILLLIKVILFLVMVLSATFVTFWLGPRLRQQKKLKLETQKQDLTVDEMSQFDGQDGRAAYVGHEGAIYDVSRSRYWQKGQHMGRHRAGLDLTEMLRQAPHDAGKIIEMKRVGKILVSGKRKQNRPEMKVFYFFAYWNLVLVFLIIFIISLWRWW